MNDWSLRNAVLTPCRVALVAFALGSTASAARADLNVPLRARVTIAWAGRETPIEVAPASPLCLGTDCPLTEAVVARTEPVAATRGVACARFISNLGPEAAALLAWFAPPTTSGFSLRFGPVHAIGGPALGLRVRF